MIYYKKIDFILPYDVISKVSITGFFRPIKLWLYYKVEKQFWEACPTLVYIFLRRYLCVFIFLLKNRLFLRQAY